MSLDLKEFFRLMVKHKASDLHLKAGSPPLVRKNKKLFLLDSRHQNVTHNDIQSSIEPFLHPHQKDKLKTEKQIDFSIGLKNIGRFRLNIFYQRGTLRLVARNIPFIIPDYQSLNLPPKIKEIASSQQDQNGLVLVTGSTGSGKSSTIISMLNDINNTFSKHIITIEDPIEFLLNDNKSLVTQRELGSDYINYNLALKATLRQDPDIIFFGEIRDVETMETTLNASNTGHLVFSTLHTNSVTDTINRVMGIVEGEKKKLFRMKFAASLKAIICQKLVIKKDGSGLVPVVEILINNPRIRKILEDQSESTSSLYEIIEESKEVWGMQSFNQHLIELVEKDIISQETALQVSPSPEKLNIHFSGLSRGKKAKLVESDKSNSQERLAFFQKKSS